MLVIANASATALTVNVTVLAEPGLTITPLNPTALAPTSLTEPPTSTPTSGSTAARASPGASVVPLNSFALAAGSSGAITFQVSKSIDAPASASMSALIYTGAQGLPADPPAVPPVSVAGTPFTVPSGAAAVAATANPVVVATATVGTPDVTARPAALSVTSSIGSATLIQYQSTDAFFTLTNQTDNPQRIDSVVVSFPSFLALTYLPTEVTQSSSPCSGEIKAEPPATELRLACGLPTLLPGDSTVVHLRINADAPLQPGSTLVVLAAHSVDTVNQTPSSSVAALTLSLSVLGESAVLSVLALPSLLLMPGLVFVVVLWCLWTIAYPKRSFAITTPAGVESKAAMWVLALLPSLLFPFIYTGIWGIFGKDRDYRKSYGLDDILYLWIMAAVLALVVWGIYTVISLVARKFFIPEPPDDANTVINKYGRRWWSGQPPSLGAKYTVGTNSQTVFVLANRSEGKALVTPLIVWTVKGTTSVPGDLEETPPSGQDWWPWIWPRLSSHREALDFQYDGSGPIIKELTLVDRTSLTDHRPQAPVLKKT